MHLPSTLNFENNYFGPVVGSIWVDVESMTKNIVNKLNFTTFCILKKKEQNTYLYQKNIIIFIYIGKNQLIFYLNPNKFACIILSQRKLNLTTNIRVTKNRIRWSFGTEYFWKNEKLSLNLDI